MTRLRLFVSLAVGAAGCIVRYRGMAFMQDVWPRVRVPVLLGLGVTYCGFFYVMQHYG